MCDMVVWEQDFRGNLLQFAVSGISAIFGRSDSCKVIILQDRPFIDIMSIVRAAYL